MCSCALGASPQTKPRLRQCQGLWLTVAWEELAEGEAPGLAGVQVGQREAQHTQGVARLAALQESQDAICGESEGQWGGALTPVLSRPSPSQRGAQLTACLKEPRV